ncbi:hypothetical protein AWB78_05425 [Caballeronia calidae]|uniref:Uncharacterized protein n=1 Tax=Caballeronia calidae TaxID=1777139 RepID=A0A158DNY4_9BURK|nr:hypothetical protein [Caballeronia calidae]SAK96329.1 hypothetical protein AWB78_05425 [Caballeronia calidae]
MSLQGEIERLHQADADILMANQRIQRQKDLIQELKRDGHDTSLALELLMTMQGTRQALIDHRKVILEHVERISGSRSREEQAMPRPDGHDI